MKWIIACLLSTATVAVAGYADAQVTDDDAKCRTAIHKNATKLGKTASKAIDACVKAQLNAPTGADCNNAVPGNPTTDSKGKITGAADKLSGAVADRCAASAAALAEFSSCPSPANGDDDGGATTGVDDFGELVDCETTLNTTGIVTLRNYILRPDAQAIAASGKAKSVEACGNGIAKNATKLWSAVAKARGKCQTMSDKDGGLYDYGCSTDDGGGKVTDAIAKATEGIVDKCGVPELNAVDLGLLHTCDNDAAGIAGCVTDAVVKSASGATAAAFEFAGVCPSQVAVALNSGTQAGVVGRLTDTRVDVGWNGLGHGLDVGSAAGRVDLSCSGPDCDSCTVTAQTSCAAGNCHCSLGVAPCNVPFVQDVCSAGATCLLDLGSPLPVSAGGNPLCAVNVLTSAALGIADIGLGSVSGQVSARARVYLGVSQGRPCPTCSGVAVGMAGTCSGGANNGGACITSGIHPDFGATSHQCQPTAASLSSNLNIDLDLTDGHVTLPYGDACDMPYGSFTCACGVCSGNQSMACNGDADCAAGGFGTCEKGSTGERKPNACDSFACQDMGAELGQCSAATAQDLFCDGIRRASGEGIITCLTNADCQALDSECPASDCGDCMLMQPRKCYLDPIQTTGVPGQQGAELVAAFCVANLSSAGKSAAFGLPGAGRVSLDWDFTSYCSDGTTEWELGGANCP